MSKGFTKSDPEYEPFQRKVDDIMDTFNISNIKWDEKERTFVKQMRTRLFVSPKQASWINDLWERI